MLLDTAIGVFLKEAVACLTGHVKGYSVSSKNLAQHFYALYCSLDEVQQSYQNFIGKKPDDNLFLVYDLNLRSLADDIRKIERLLSLDDNELYDVLRNYSDMSGPIDPGTAIIRELRWHDISHSDLDDTMQSLENFLEQNFETQDMIG